MKIAMPYQAGFISQHFGASSEFVLFEVENGTITGKKILISEDHSNLVSVFQEEGVKTVIVNIISRPLLEMLFYSGIQVVTRATGEVEQVARDFLKGELVTGSPCRSGDQHLAH